MTPEPMPGDPRRTGAGPADGRIASAGSDGSRSADPADEARADERSDESSVTEPTLAEPRNILADCLIPGIALAFTLYYLSTITEVPWISQASAATVGTLLLFSILAFAIRSSVRIRRGQETLNLPAALRNVAAGGRSGRRRLALLALTIAYVVFLGTLGFTLATFAFVLVAIVLLSSVANWRRALGVALGCSIAGYALFIHLFGTRFPEGPIERWLEALLG